MPFELKLPDAVALGVWKVKIRDRERNEPPHVSIISGTRVWRWGLREQAWLDKEPPGREVPEDVVAFMKAKLAELISAWDSKHPENPVTSVGGNDANRKPRS